MTTVRVTAPLIRLDRKFAYQGDVIDLTDAQLAEHDGFVELLDQPVPDDEPPIPDETNDDDDETTDDDLNFEVLDGTVDDVIDWVKAHPDHIEAVYAAEVEGKNRTSLIEALERLNA